MKKIIILLAVIILAIIAWLYYSDYSLKKYSSDNKAGQNSINNSAGENTGMQAQIPVDLTDEQKIELKAGAESHNPTELTFHITGGSFYFTPNEIRVKQGDKVKIIFTNVGGAHNLILEAFEVYTKTIKGGESDTIEFTADKKGVFEFYCSVGNGYHRMKGQIGVLLVE